MLTLLLYVLIVGLVAAVLFLLASAIFGRGEELGPLPEGTTATVLPAEGITGADVRALRFQQVVRGYKAGEVDWALARLAARIDELQLELAHARGDTTGRGLAVEAGAEGVARHDTAVAPRHDTERPASPWPAPSTPEKP
ncbi:DivIVA domain-containing protein [Nocardia xishanensis]|uniref:DivIVA domain-containing protein n=1 Tax=Nocardia xishanensis TaxID=238964 RepID=UPI0033EBF529